MLIGRGREMERGVGWRRAATWGCVYPISAAKRVCRPVARDHDRRDEASRRWRRWLRSPTPAASCCCACTPSGCARGPRGLLRPGDAGDDAARAPGRELRDRAHRKRARAAVRLAHPRPPARARGPQPHGGGARGRDLAERAGLRVEIEVIDRRAGLEPLLMRREELRRLAAAVHELSADQRLVLACESRCRCSAPSSVGARMDRSKYRKVTQRGRARSAAADGPRGVSAASHSAGAGRSGRRTR